MASVARRVGQGLAAATAASGVVLIGVGAPASAGPYSACYEQSQDPVDGYTTEDPATNTQCTTNPNGTFVSLKGADLPAGGTLRVKAKIVEEVEGIQWANVTFTRGSKVIRLRVRVSRHGFVSLARKPKLPGYWALTIAFRGNTITTNFYVH